MATLAASAAWVLRIGLLREVVGIDRRQVQRGLGDIDAFLAAKGALSADGLFPEKGADTAFRALASIDAEIAKATLDLAAVYTNDFAKKANAKYPRG